MTIIVLLIMIVGVALPWSSSLAIIWKIVIDIVVVAVGLVIIVVCEGGGGGSTPETNNDSDDSGPRTTSRGW